MTTIHEARPFNLRYIVREPCGIHGDDLRATHRTAYCNYLYITRQNGEDEYGPTPDFAARGDLVAHGRVGPIRSFAPALAGAAIWQAADLASRDRMPDRATAMHAVGSLPPEVGRAQWRLITAAFCEDQFAAKGMVADWAIHYRDGDVGGTAIAPHMHIVATSRMWDARDPGRWQKAWLATPASVRALADAWYATTGLYPVGYVPAAAG